MAERGQVDHSKISDRNQTEIYSFVKWVALSKMSTEENSLAEDSHSYEQLDLPTKLTHDNARSGRCRGIE